MIKLEAPPADEECELTLLGPGYGEAIAIHVGDGKWTLVDSYLDADGTPAALRYLDNIGVHPADAVSLVIATHWHDDHIRGMASMVEQCPAARFCCSGALRSQELLAMMGRLEKKHLSAAGSGVRELHRVFSRLRETKRVPAYAFANRLMFRGEYCDIWSLSPGHRVFQASLQSIADLVPHESGSKTRLPSLSPNEIAVVLWIEFGNFSLLLGADMERRGWTAILSDTERPAGRASVYKVPHHGSKNADEPAVWKRMLEAESVAVLTPWRRGSHVLPTMPDARRISKATPKAWITDKGLSRHANIRHDNRAVARTLRESGARIQRLEASGGMIRLRRVIGSGAQWTVETFGNACNLVDYAA